MRGVALTAGHIALTWRLRRAPARSAEGVLVFDVTSTQALGAKTTERVAAALEVIEKVDPRRLRRLRAYVRRLVVWQQPFAFASFNPRGSTIFLDSEFVLGYSPEILSSFIVHEATHARLHACGVSDVNRNYAAIERRCFLEQLSYLQRMPRTENIRQWVSERLIALESRPSKDDEEKAMRAQRVTFIRSIGLPRWIEAFVIRYMLPP